MRTENVLKIAAGLGIETQPARGSSGGAFPCPSCSAPRRHTKTRDKRAAVGVRRDGQGWRCFQCDVSGDALDLVAYHLRGDRLAKLHDSGKAEVREWCLQWLGSAFFVARKPSASRSATPAAAKKPVRAYPPAEEVSSLWALATSPSTDSAVASWLSEHRGIDPAIVATKELARALGPNAEDLPRWAGFGGDADKPWRSWASVGVRLVVPLFDASGGMRSVLFRRVFETTGQWPPKSMAVAGFERAGLVMANAPARRLLMHPQPFAEGTRIVIAEGELDWLTDCLAWARSDEIAIFGVISGSWTEETPELAQRIPRGARVTIRTHNDDAGDRIAGKIITTLGTRCTVLRRRTSADGDDG
jgi:hypothetical protein